MAEAEPLRTTAVTVEIESEAPYAENIIRDILQELASTLDFTGMYEGHVRVKSPNGEDLYSWEFGEEAR